MKVKASHIVLDACCILNFCASGYFKSILHSLPAQVVVTEVVREKELLTLKCLENIENESATQFEESIIQEILTVVDFESELEEENFVNYAFELGDDGDAATCAIAISREWAIATDDKKEISFFSQEAPHLQVLSTLEIIQYWANESKISTIDLRAVLESIRTKGRYVPHRSHPLFNWWKESIKE
jgi:hypothetical protein